MGNTQTISSSSIQRQEEYVQREMTKIDPNTNYSSSSFGHGSYSRRQIEGKLREEYHGYNTYKNRDTYVLSQDWVRMSASRRPY
jgi:hypothetical protein